MEPYGRIKTLLAFHSSKLLLNDPHKSAFDFLNFEFGIFQLFFWLTRDPMGGKKIKRLLLFPEVAFKLLQTSPEYSSQST